MKHRIYKKQRHGDEDEAFVFSFNHHGPMPPIPPMPPMPPMAGRYGFKTQDAMNVYQGVDDDVLEILLVLPGIEKSNLKVRSKTDRISISAKMKEKYVEKLGGEKITRVIDLVEEVLADQSKAKYEDGILHITMPVANPAEPVDIEE